MKIALVGPELEENLALRYIDAAVRQAGHEPAIFDFHAAEQIDEITRAIVDFGADVVGLSTVFTARAREFVNLAKRLREIGFSGHITAGGHFASFHARELLEDYGAIDTIVHGEGEETLVELLDSLDRPERVAGVSWRSADGEIYTTGPRRNSDDLDQLAHPTRDTEHCHDYLGLRIANILSGRGCYGNCRFCSIVAWHKQNGGRRFRQRSVESLAGEMIDLYHERDIRIFNFHDDNFFLPSREGNLERLGRLKELLDAGRVGRIALQVKARPDSVEPDVFTLLKEIGLFRVFLGVETAAVDGLRLLGRGIRREQNVRAMKILERLGIHTTFNLLMFDPDGELDGIRQNIAFMRRYARFPLNFCRVEVYAGTDIERQLREENRLIGDSFGYTYRIADPRVQLMYEMFREIFTPRNFEAGGANLRAMQIDYYYHIFEHFFADRAGGLKRQVKRRIAALNRNSAALLSEICRLVDRSPLPDPAIVEEATRDLLERREAFDRVWDVRAESILGTIRTRADVPRQPRGRRISIAASVAATLLTVSVGGCRDGDDSGTHMSEMAPAPLDPGQPEPQPPDEPAVEPTEPAVEPAEPATPPEIPELSTEQAEAVQKKIDEEYAKPAIEAAIKHQMMGKTVEVKLELDEKGAVVKHEIILPKPAEGEAVEPSEEERSKFKDDLAALIEKWDFPATDKAGRCIIELEFNDLSEIIEPPEWEMCEMAPFEPDIPEPTPLPLPDTHMHEMAPIEPPVAPEPEQPIEQPVDPQEIQPREFQPPDWHMHEMAPRDLRPDRE